MDDTPNPPSDGAILDADRLADRAAIQDLATAYASTGLNRQHWRAPGTLSDSHSSTRNTEQSADPRVPGQDLTRDTSVPIPAARVVVGHRRRGRAVGSA